MKYFIIIILLLLTDKMIARTQTQLIPCELLWIILKEKDFEIDVAKKALIQYEIDTVHGIETVIIDQISDTSKKAEEPHNNYVFIDTLGFFAPTCNGIVDNNSIVLRSKPLSLSEERKELRRIFWITDVQMSKDDDNYIVLFRKETNEGFVYYFSMKEKFIKILKKKSFEL